MGEEISHENPDPEVFCSDLGYIRNLRNSLWVETKPLRQVSQQLQVALQACHSASQELKTVEELLQKYELCKQRT